MNIKLIFWCEPFSKDFSPCFFFCTPETAIKYRKELFPYEKHKISDDAALSDFIAVNFASTVEVDLDLLQSIFGSLKVT